AQHHDVLPHTLRVVTQCRHRPGHSTAGREADPCHSDVAEEVSPGQLSVHDQPPSDNPWACQRERWAVAAWAADIRVPQVISWGRSCGPNARAWPRALASCGSDVHRPGPRDPPGPPDLVKVSQVLGEHGVTVHL